MISELYSLLCLFNSFCNFYDIHLWFIFIRASYYSSFRDVYVCIQWQIEYHIWYSNRVLTYWGWHVCCVRLGLCGELTLPPSAGGTSPHLELVGVIALLELGEVGDWLYLCLIYLRVGGLTGSMHQYLPWMGLHNKCLPTLKGLLSWMPHQV